MDHWMPYALFDLDGRHPAIGLFTSSDGVEWESAEEPVHRGTGEGWDRLGVVPSSLIERDGRLELFYLGFDRHPAVNGGAGLPAFELGRLVSDDGGRAWSPDAGGAPLVDTGERGWPGVSVVFADGRYLVYGGDDLGSSGIFLVEGTLP